MVPPRLRIPRWKGLSADSEEKHEPVSDIDTVAVDSLKVLDPNRPIREGDIARLFDHLVGGGEQRLRHHDAEHARGLVIDH